MSSRPSTNFEFDRLLARLARALKRVGIPYMVIGGQAVLQYGRARFTGDIDLTLGIPLTDLNRLLALLPPLKLQPRPDEPEAFVKAAHVLPCQVRDSALRVDFAFSDSPYELAAIARGPDVRIERTPVRFCSPEDLVIHKIIAGRPTDLMDVRSVLLKNPGLDDAYIRAWLKQFGELLEQPLVERYGELERETRRS